MVFVQYCHCPFCMYLLSWFTIVVCTYFQWPTDCLIVFSLAKVYCPTGCQTRHMLANMHCREPYQLLFGLTHWGRVMHMCVSTTNQHCSAPSHYLNQSWHVVNWLSGNIFQWNITWKSKTFIQGTTLENIYCQSGGHCGRSQCVLPLMRSRMEKYYRHILFLTKGCQLQCDQTEYYI